MIEKIEKITDLSFLNMFVATYKDKDNNSRKWNFVSRKKTSEEIQDSETSNPDGVCIVPLRLVDGKFSEIIMIKQFRPPLGDYEYAFPAGLIDAGETIDAAAKRELKEETGLNLEEIFTTTPRLYSSAGLTDESIVVVFCYCSGDITTNNAEDDENIEVIRIKAEDICDFDVKTIKIGMRDYLLLAVISNILISKGIC